MQSNGEPEPELNDGFEQGGWQVRYSDEDMDRLTADWVAAAAHIYQLSGKPKYGSVKNSVSRQVPT